MVQVRSLDDVLEWCTRLAQITREDLEIDARPAAATTGRSSSGVSWSSAFGFRR